MKKKTAVELAAEMFKQGYATGEWYKKFSKAVAREMKPKKKVKKPKK